jgi:hypothetical protein
MVPSENLKYIRVSEHFKNTTLFHNTLHDTAKHVLVLATCAVKKENGASGPPPKGRAASPLTAI